MTVLKALGTWLILGTIHPAAAIPPPPEQFLAECQSPTYASDVVVCGDDELLAMDERLRKLYEPLRDALQPATAGGLLDSRALVESQDAWFRRRSLCAFSPHHAACLRAAYRERLRVLGAIESYAREPSREVLRAVCRNAPWGRAPTWISGTQEGEMFLTDGAGRVRAVAIGETPRDDWSPYLRHEAEGSQLRLFPLEGPVITCELREPN